jgi:hypothetical protein
MRLVRAKKWYNTILVLSGENGKAIVAHAHLSKLRSARRWSKRCDARKKTARLSAARRRRRWSALTKAQLQSGVSYGSGYPGAPISHLVDVLTDSAGIPAELGVHFEPAVNEAGAAAMLAASINDPVMRRRQSSYQWNNTISAAEDGP